MQKLLLLISIVIITGPASVGQKREDPPWLKEFVGKRIVYQVPGMKSVRVKKNLIYKRTGNSELQMDVYSPRVSRGRLPAILFIHGGRIPPNLLTTPKDWAAYVSFGELVAASGFVGVTFNHRFYAWESLADSQSDVVAAIKYVRQQASTLGVDPDRIVLWAVSSGGIFLSHPLRERPSYLKSIVAYYTQLDLQNARKSAPPSVSDAMLKMLSPVYHLEDGPDRQSGQTPAATSARFPPMFIARAGLDDANLNEGIDRFVQVALKKNVAVELVNHASGHHGFDIEDDNDRSREILKRTIEFIRNNTGK